MSRALPVTLLLWLGLTSASLGQTFSDKSTDELMQLDLESLLELKVVSSTKTEQRSGQSPAVITVITGEELRGRGYRTLAEALRSIPGFYDVYDLVTHNVGIRGVNGGARAGGNVLKLMIDGHPVDYRSTTGNFFGEELIPLPLVDRVEIIRGPASALYGANAYLGVVNVLLKRGADLSGVKLLGTFGLMDGHPGWAGGATVGLGEEKYDFIAGVTLARYERSGLALPASSPVLDDATSTIGSRGISQGDFARPKSIAAKASVGTVQTGELSVLASLQNLDAGGEFQELGTLIHGTRITLLNENYRLAFQRELGEKGFLQLSAHYLHGAPTSEERLDLGRADYLLVRNTAVSGFGFAAETRWAILPSLTLSAGADWVREHHLFQAFDRELAEDVRLPDGTVVRSAGTVLPGDGHGASGVFDNVGGLLQVLLTLGEDWSAVAGARLDWHSLYGVNPSLRAGIVYAPPSRPLSLKLLYGSSFKAPSAVQLYTQPQDSFDLQGNADLKPQTARTLELAATFGVTKMAEISLNLFATSVSGRVEFVQRGSFLQSANSGDEWLGGGELDARLKPLSALNLKLSAGVAKTIARTGQKILSGTPQTFNALFPAVQIHAVVDYTLPWAGLQLSAEASYIGPRTTSQSNALINRSVYTVPGYVYTAAAVTTRGLRLIGERETALSLRVTNLLNQHWTEPGFGGVDVPAQGLCAFLSVAQSL